MLTWSHQWSFLSHRFTVLTRSLKVYRDDLDDLTQTPWLAVGLEEYAKLWRPGTDRGQVALRSLREAILLTGWMGSSKATHELWKEEVNHHIRAEHALDSNARWRLQPQFEFQFDTRYSGDLDWYKVTSCLFGYENFTDAFFTDCELMNQQYQQLDESQVMAPAIPIRLVFSSIPRSDDVHEIPRNLRPPRTTRRKISSQIKFIQGIVKLIQQIQREATRLQQLYPARPRFRLHSIELHLGDYSFSPALIRELERLLALDIKIHKLKVPTVMTKALLVQPQLWRHAWARLLLTVTGHVNAKTRLHHTIDELTISLSDNVPEEMYQAIASVMVSTQTVKKLILGQIQAEGQEAGCRWRWLAYALFSRSSSHSIVAFSTSVKLDASPQDVINVIYGGHPESQLVNDSMCEENNDFGAVNLSQGTNIRLQGLYSTDLVVNWTTGRTFETVRKDKTSATVEIIVPGYGLAAIDQACCSDKRIRRYRDTKKSDKLPTTRIRIRDLQVECLKTIELLPAIGKDLDYLTINPSDDEIVHDLDALLTCCPNLRSLSIANAVVHSFQSFIDAFEPGNGLRLLDIGIKRAVDENSLIAFLREVADSSSKTARRLHHLILCLNTPLSNDTITKQFAQVVARVTKDNRTLHSLDIFSPEAVTQYIHEELEETRRAPDTDDMESLINQEILVPHRLPMSTKCACLSVFREQQAAKGNIMLDRLAIRLIFEFAADQVAHRVAISVAECEERVETNQSVPYTGMLQDLGSDYDSDDEVRYMFGGEIPDNVLGFGPDN